MDPPPAKPTRVHSTRHGSRHGNEGRVRRLSRDAILAAALRVLETQGADALTVRSLGEELDMHATAFYRYFRDKEELLRGVADLILGEVIEDLPTVNLAERGHALAAARVLTTRLRRVLVARPAAAEVLAQGPSRQPNELTFTEMLLGVLRAAGLDDVAATSIYHVLVEYAVGSARIDAPLANEGDREREAVYRRWRADYLALSAAEYPNATSLAPHMYAGADAQFERGLDLLFAGINQELGG